MLFRSRDADQPEGGGDARVLRGERAEVGDQQAGEDRPARAHPVALAHQPDHALAGGHAHAHAELTGNIGNLALLKLAARLGLLSGERAQAAHAAYRRLRQLQHALRLKGEQYARIEPGEVAVEIRAVRDLWQSVMGDD